MKRTSIVLAGLLSIAGFATHAESPDPSGQFAHTIRAGKTRADVRAELAEAQRTGDILAAGEGGTAYERNPAAFPARVHVAGKSREQVRAETLQALREGDVTYGEVGLTQREVFPHRYMAGGGVPMQRSAGILQRWTQR